MTAFTRRTCVVRLSLTAVALLVLPDLGLAQVPIGGPWMGGAPMAPPPIGGAAMAEMFPQNPEMARQIQQTAPQYIKAAARGDRDWITVAQILQRVLDLRTDFLLKKEVKDAAGKISVQYSSGRAEAERLLASLPPVGLAAYRVKYGGPAQILLAQSRANPALLEEAARRYYFTDAGAEALTQLGVSELDHGHVDEAADHFRRLLQRPDAAALPPLALFEAALAFHAVGDSTREAQAMQLLNHRLPPAGLNVGGRQLNSGDFEKEVARWPVAAAVVSSDWPMFRGDARRTGRSDGEFPTLEPRGKPVLLPIYPEVAKALAPPANSVPVVGPALPGFVPIAVAGKIIYRGPDGLHALDAASGLDAWPHGAAPGRPSLSLAAMLKDDNQRLQLLSQWLPKYAGLPSLLDENATLGALSSDGRHVFFIEDTPVPAHPNDVIALQQPQGQPGAGRPYFSSLEETLYHNRLRAVDAQTGEFRWEVGAWDRAVLRALTQPGSPPEFTDVFFLGPPLPVGRRLFALVEQTTPDHKRNKDLVLLCLDPDTGRLLWSQDVASAADPLWLDPARRMQPVQLTYADGVLIIPTHTGSVVAIDPLTHDLLWAHVYREPVPNPNGVPGFDPNQYEGSWKGAAPIVQGDRVVLTAPDGDSILCLNLRDGAQLWKAPGADDDLYVGGVFADPAGGDKVLIVGRTQCRTLSLASGAEVWKGLATGPPSGLGTARGGQYLLPLRRGAIFAIDVANPNASTMLEGRADDLPPGNLIFHGGDLWSQSARAVTAYKRLGPERELLTAAIARDPKNAAARIERGRLLLSEGDAAGAVEDWRAALDENPPPALAVPTRERLYQALTMLLRRDFAANEKLLGLYESLCFVPPPAGATPEKVRACQAEQHRRRIHLLAVTAHGRATQGRADLALQDYKKIFAAAVPQERMRTTDDPRGQDRPDLWEGAQTRPDLWVQERIADLVRQATAQQQQVLKAQIDQDWQGARSADGEAGLVRFIALYGGVAGPLGAHPREARLLLAERWMDDRDRRHALDTELQLHWLRDLSDSPETAAAAQYAQARLLTRNGLLSDAVEAYRGLARDFPAVRLPDGRTGAAPLQDLAVDKRFAAYLDDPFAGRPTGRIKAKEIAERHTPQTLEMPCDPADGVIPPSCRRLRFTLDAQTYTLKVASTDGGSESWSAPLPVPTEFLRQITVQYGGFTPAYEATGHFLVFSVGPFLVGVDRFERRARWVRSLLPADLPEGVHVLQITAGGPDGSVGMQTSDGAPNQRLGLLGSIGPNGVMVQTRSGVAALDVSTGALRWLRSETAPMLSGFGDAEHLYLVESHSGGEAFAVRAVRTADGVSTPIADASDVYNHHLRTLGRCILAATGGGDDDAPLEVRYYDVQAGKDLWQGSYPPHSHVLESSVPELNAVVAPDGTVTVVDLTTCQETAKLSLNKKDFTDPKGQNQLVRGMLLRDRTQLYVALQTLPGPKAASLGDPQPNVVGTTRFTEVNGMIYAFDRATGSRNWATNGPIEGQLLLLDLFEESPVLLLTALQARQTMGLPAGNVIQVACTRSIDKRTGKVLYQKVDANTNGADPFFLLQVDARTGTVDLVNSAMRLRHVIEPTRGERGASAP